MKFRTLRQIALASAVSLGLSFGITACGINNTIDFLYVASSKNATGNISIYAVNSESGALIQLHGGSPVPSLGRNPVAMVASPNGKNLYVVNHDDNTVVWFAIGTDGKLYSQKVYNTPGSNPDAIAMNAAGTLLFVVDAFQAQYSPSNPGPGAVIVAPVGTDGSLTLSGSSPSTPVCNNPVAINVLNNGSALYVANDPAGQLPALGDLNSSSNTGAPIVYPAIGKCASNSSTSVGSGQISSFTVGSDGTLTEAASSPFTAGVAPASIASDPTDRFVYVADSKSNQLIGYGVQPNGLLITLGGANSLYPTGVFPDSVIADPRGQFVYAANYNDGSVSAFVINQSTGVLSAVAGGTYAADSGTAGIFLEPAYGRYLYTANFIGNSIAGLFLSNPTTGTLTQVQNSPYPTAAQPTAVAAVRHGTHAINVTPQY